MTTAESSAMVDSAMTEPNAVEEPTLAAYAIRKQLPTDLGTWRGPFDMHGSDHTEAIWEALGPFFADRGYTLWPHGHIFITTASEDDMVVNGYMYAGPHRAQSEEMWGSIHGVVSHMHHNALTRAARGPDAQDVVLRVLAIGEDGKEHVDLLKTVARSSWSLVNSNHTLPLLDLLALDDITFGVFPMVGYSCSEVYGGWAKSSVRDILEVIAQCLEALVFLHACGIAHRDAFKDNFVIQWVPESLRAGHNATSSRPRVYMINFELAVRFPLDSPAEERVCVGLPSTGSLPGGAKRPAAPETLSDEPYDPFKLDVWQLGKTFSDFKSTIPEIDKVLASMVDPDPATRPTAYDAMKTLLDAVGAVPPASLIIEPDLESLPPESESVAP
ncbi:hypothetical protein GSI_09692 [Ganoderma sinense ZZ0214-1]|uniref:Protein kinase domain-containing protein n=1 Tax=Ganoderma sinense ZZ0214-1 TaxID=1077348 RepID=A0A2G8S307_9APHY|nr:hypothetical protein GSI_09692 [Ganoderma sinense ZZ0214-1]